MHGTVLKYLGRLCLVKNNCILCVPHFKIKVKEKKMTKENLSETNQEKYCTEN